METLKTQKNTSKPQIYVACLAAYNSGFLHGEWITPKANKDELLEQFEKIQDECKLIFENKNADYGDFTIMPLWRLCF